ncbi:unnamed protein product [Trichogramma brassicae]|uniref:Uncharacterized protein n=1 Tax=Trichogramma brassicae TaxID=86971 RepID=A0A6H5IED4_9HYME|nr:unnamed protein product [Trichogramma brassicae]
MSIFMRAHYVFHFFHEVHLLWSMRSTYAPNPTTIMCMQCIRYSKTPSERRGFAVLRYSAPANNSNTLSAHPPLCILKLPKQRQPLQCVTSDPSSLDDGPTAKIKRRVSFARNRRIKNGRYI